MPVGVRLGRVTVVEEVLEIPEPEPTAHTVELPDDAENSWAASPV